MIASFFGIMELWIESHLSLTMSESQINPEVLRWAWKRAGLTQKQIFDKHPRAKHWVQGGVQPTVAELKAFGRTVRAGLGYLVLPAPPED